MNRHTTLFITLLGLAQFAAAEDFTKKPLPDGTKAALQAIPTFRTSAGFQVNLFAAEPQLASPVAFCLDERNRVFVAEEYRFNLGTEENRTRPFLLDDDLQINTVDERLKMFEKFADRFEGGMDWFTRVSDQVRLLEDRDGDGRADFSSVFAGGFNGPLDGLGSGVIAKDGDIYFTCVPHLWLLRDEDNDGKAEVRKSLHRGFGVNAAFLGHDLHGLAWGPDGRLYFSVGDRGFHVKTHEDQVLHGPRHGAVFRCYPDGSELEVVYTGLRNPQELAFDQFGNLFAVDNNCDKGDHSRLVYIVKGGSAGWNMAYQHMTDPDYLTGPWHAEKTWHLQNDDQPQWILPPVGKIGAGPSGFTFTSGVGWGSRYTNKFFYCNYTGNGGVEAFGVEPDGAGFKMVDHHDFLKPIKATDVDFSYDGKMYVSDFVGLKWDGGPVGGRIYTVTAPGLEQNKAVAEVTKLFSSGIAKLETERLLALLGHDDMRARLRAQYELADRRATKPLTHLALRTTASQVDRLHALWGLGQIARQRPSVLSEVLPLLNDKDVEVRAQTAHLLSEYWRNWERLESGFARPDGAKSVRIEGPVPDRVVVATACERLLPLLHDVNARVRMFAINAIRELQPRDAALQQVAAFKKVIDGVTSVLAVDPGHDRFLRHAIVQCLKVHDDLRIQVRTWNSASRMASLLATTNPQEINQFLYDTDVRIATEAARLLHDFHPDSSGDLAEMAGAVLTDPGLYPDAFVRRVINANVRRGDEASVRRVAGLSAHASLSAAVRNEALAALLTWCDDSRRDRVNGNWWEKPKRDARLLQDCLQPMVTRLLVKNTDEFAEPTIDLFNKYNLNVNLDGLNRQALTSTSGTPARLAAIRLLAYRKFPGLDDTLDQLLKTGDPLIRAAARRHIALSAPSKGRMLISIALKSNRTSIREQQLAVETLAELGGTATQRTMTNLGRDLVSGKLRSELQFEVLELLKKKNSPLAAEYEKSGKGELAAYRVAFSGGDAQQGKRLFATHRTAQCIRCHKVNGTGGDAGPDLSRVAEKNDAEYLTRSLINPDVQIAKGFASVSLVLTSGKVVSGIIKSEDDKTIELETPDKKRVRIVVEDIDDRSRPKSPMPTMRKTLSLREIRDIVAYLKTLKP